MLSVRVELSRPLLKLAAMSPDKNSLSVRARIRTPEPIGRTGAPTLCESAALTPFLRKTTRYNQCYLS